MANGTTYTLPAFTGLFGVGRLLRDQAISDSQLDYHTEARVRSGDYFVTLASTLDSLNKEIENYQTRTEIESIVSELIYLQDHYTITKDDQ